VPLFTTLLNYRYRAPDAGREWDSQAAGTRKVTSRLWTSYPITISIDDFGEDLLLTVQSDRRIDPARMTAYMAAAVQSLVTALERVPDTSVAGLSVLSKQESDLLLRSFNATATSFPSDRKIHQLFEAQVERDPGAVAVFCADESLSYADLNCKANQLARYLRKRGVGPDVLVAVCIERSLDMIVSLLGVLKAGGAYIPLDPTHPPDRLAHILADARPRIILTQQALRPVLQDFPVNSPS